MKKYMLGNPNGMNMNQIIELGNSEHFSKLTCSIIPTIDYWKDLNNKVLSELIGDDCEICFEYPVKSINDAPSSYTDVMLISHDAAIAVESKWTEKIGDLCKNQKAVRKDEVQTHWINIIGNYIQKEFKLAQFQEIEYQLLHRVASACWLNKPNCKVVYQIFYTNALKVDFIKEIIKIKSLLDTNKIEFYVNSVKIKVNNKYENLNNEIQGKTKKQRIELIKFSIKKTTLFKFSNEELILL